MSSPWTPTQRLRLFWRKFKLNIPRGALVLEVGSGGAPHFRSDVLCDKYLSADGTARIGQLKIDRPFVVGDAEALPFVDKAFDYIICFHVLEHLDNPERCLLELMRVGRAGYIETPGEIIEKIQGWSCHKWFVRAEKKKLILTQKRDPVFDPLLHISFHSLAATENQSFLNFVFNNHDLFTVRFEWHDQIDYQIEPLIRQEQRFADFEEPQIEALSDWDNFEKPAGENVQFALDQLIKTWVNGTLRRIHLKKDLDLNGLLACPTCRSRLDHNKDSFVCQKCQASYQRKNGLPVLLSDLAEPSKGECSYEH